MRMRGNDSNEGYSNFSALYRIADMKPYKHTPPMESHWFELTQRKLEMGPAGMEARVEVRGAF